MPRYVVKAAEDHYLLWSTVVDAPLTGKGYTKADARTLFGPDEVARADADEDPDDFKWNRAGPNESFATREEIIKRFPIGKIDG